MTDGPNEQPIAKPSAFWGVISAQANARASTAEIWGAIRDYAAGQGVGLPSGMFGAVNTLRGLATANRTAGERLAGAAPGDFITNAVVGRQIYARSADEMASFGRYHVTFNVTTTRSGQAASEYFRLEYSDANLPNTVGELRDDVLAYSAGLGESYGTDVSDVSDIRLGAF